MSSTGRTLAAFSFRQGFLSSAAVGEETSCPSSLVPAHGKQASREPELKASQFGGRVAYASENNPTIRPLGIKNLEFIPWSQSTRGRGVTYQWGLHKAQQPPGSP